MPIIVPSPPYHPSVPARRPSEANHFTWTSPTGVETNLSQSFTATGGIFTRPGTIGLGMPEIDYFQTNPPVFDGSDVRGFRLPAREIDLPLHIWGVDRNDLVTRWRALIRDMKPQRNAIGFLTMTDHNGYSRSIPAYYAGGLQGQDDDVNWRLRDISPVITLLCPSPYWLGAVFEQPFSVGGLTGTHFYPILPWAVGSSIVDGALTITNDGDGDTFPVFTIVGPCDSITLTNATTGKRMRLNNGLLANHSVEIDTRKERRTVIETTNVNTTINRFGDLEGSLWTFSEGVNTVDLAAPGATVDTSLTVKYQIRYLTAY